MYNIATISVNELKTLIDENPALCLIDVRELYEWQAGNIAHALHIPKDELGDRIHDVVSDKTQPIYLHCRSGVRSLYAAEHLLDLGFTNVYSVNGGINAWVAMTNSL